MAAIHTANKLAEIRAEGSSGGEKGEGDAGGSKNPIMRINEIAMTHGLCVEWEMVSEQVCFWQVVEKRTSLAIFWLLYS